MRNLLYGFGIFVSLLVLAFLIIRTPDTNPIAMAEKYGLGSVQRICYGDGNCVRIKEDGNKHGPVLLLLHGSNDSLLTWRPLVEHLGKAYRILSLDLPGHGLSGPDINNDYSADAMMEAVTALANHANVDRFTIGGNSMGGWISWRYALAYPKRIEGLILIDASGAPLPPDTPKANVYLGAKLMRIPLLRPLIEQVTPRIFVERSLKDSVHDPKLVTKELVDQYWELLLYPGNRRATAIRATTDREPAFADRLAKINTPTLILWGEEDQVVPLGAAQTFKERIPNSELIVFEKVAHLPQVETSDLVAKAINNFMEVHASNTLQSNASK